MCTHKCIIYYAKLPSYPHSVYTHTYVFARLSLIMPYTHTHTHTTRNHTIVYYYIQCARCYYI